MAKPNKTTSNLPRYNCGTATDEFCGDREKGMSELTECIQGE